MSLKEIFQAKNIAVIGASKHPEKVGHIIFKNLLNNPSLNIFPVNVNEEPIFGHKTYHDVLEIPYVDVDLAIIVVKAEFVSEVLKQCGMKKIKNAVIISAGFKETGNVGLEEEIKSISEQYGITLIGPNVLGFINPYRELNASFFAELPKKGGLAFISQSGAIGDTILDMALSRNLGFSGFVSLGNMLDTDVVSSLEYFGEDRNTKTIIIYIESLKNNTGREFIDLCKKISKKKKIIAIKAGKSKNGLEAAKTHTASVSSPAEIYSAAFKQSGVIEVDSAREMLLLAEIFEKFDKIGKKALVVGNAGGAGVLISDVLSETGIDLVSLPEKNLNELDKIVPTGYSRRNPLDILGDATAQRYKSVLLSLDKEKFFDFFILLLTPQAMTQALETAQILENIKKPTLCCFIGGDSIDKARKYMKSKGFINFEDISDLKVLKNI